MSPWISWAQAAPVVMVEVADEIEATPGRTTVARARDERAGVTSADATRGARTAPDRRPAAAARGRLTAGADPRERVAPMDSDYERATTATSLEGLPDVIREAMVAHAQARMITLQPVCARVR